MKKMLFTGLLLILLTFWHADFSDATTIDADAFAAGTDISTLFPGVTLSTVFGNDPYNPAQTGGVFSVQDAFATTGLMAFGQTPFDSTWGNGFFEYLRVDFHNPTNRVALDFFANDISDGNPELIAFDVFGNEIGRETGGNVALGTPLTLEISRLSNDISAVWAFWDEKTRLENGGLDNLSYGNVAATPLPPSILLMGTGIVGLAGTGIRRKRIVGGK